jgi:hypothetical protein
MHAGLGGLYRVVLVVNGGSRAGQVVEFVHLDGEGKRDFVAQQLEMRIAEQVDGVIPGPGIEIVRAEVVVALGQQPLAKVGADKARASGDQDALARIAAPFHNFSPFG